MTSHSETENPYTAGIARFVSNLQYEAIPVDVTSRLKLLILDSIGCGLYGAAQPWSRILQKRLTTLDTTRACGVWGTSVSLSAPHAALVNGMQIQGFELDDVHRAGVLHVGAVVLPALVAIAEMQQRMTGKEFLTAAIAGYEVGPRVGLCMGPEHIGQGWHSGATLGVFSAAAGAARGLRLTEEQTVHAIGIAGTQASGLMAAQYGAMVKRMHAGRASQSGLYGALFAESGFTGIVNVLESPYGGFCTTFSRSNDRFDLTQLTAGLGEVWQTMGVSLKFYSCVASNHTSLDALRVLRREHPFSADDVVKIVIHGSQVTMDHVGWTYQPQGLTAAQLNLSYCLATFLLEGDCFVEQFTEDKLADPARMALANKVSVRHDSAITEKGAMHRHTVRLELYLSDGTRLEKTIEAARGSERNFASDREIVEKYEKLSRDPVGLTKARQLCDLVLNLETVPDMQAITGLLYQ